MGALDQMLTSRTGISQWTITMNNMKPVSRGLAKVGAVVPVSNSNLEPDLVMMAPPGVSVHFSRSGGYDVNAIPDEQQMRQYSDAHPTEVVDNLQVCGSDIVLYGCTSATLAQGPEYDQKFRAEIENRTGLPAISAASALVEVLLATGADQFAFTSPYVESLNDIAIEFIESFGVNCVGRRDTPEPWSNPMVAEAAPDVVIQMALDADCEAADAIVISCTDFRAVEAVTEIEQHTGKPVVTSNQAMMALGLKQLGIGLGDSILSQHKISNML